jgi:hypothetical protein
MTSVIQLLALPLVHALGWTLLHFVWQGAVVAVMLACTLALIPVQASRLRYVLACAAMLLVIVLPVARLGMLAANPQTSAIAAADNLGHALDARVNQPAGPWLVHKKPHKRVCMPMLHTDLRNGRVSSGGHDENT